MKNIFHLSTYLQGGAGRVICDLIRWQQKLEKKITCVINHKEYSGYQNYKEHVSELKSLGVLYHVDDWFKREQEGLSKTAKELSRIVQERPCDLIHCHASVPAYVALRVRDNLRSSFPIIQTMHGWGSNKSAEHELMDLTTMSKLDKVIVVSQASKQLMLDKGLKEKLLTVIPNGIDPTRQRKLYSHQEPFWRKPADADIWIACIGTLCERKNQLALINALALLPEEGPRVNCMLIGDGDGAYVEQLRIAIEHKGLQPQIQIAGYQPGITAHLNCFDCVVLPSRAEGLPLIILEAFREQVCVLASDIPEHREILGKNEFGLLFSEGSAQSLAEAIIDFASRSKTKNKDQRIRAFHLFQQYYSLNNMIQQYDFIYDQLL